MQVTLEDLVIAAVERRWRQEEGLTEHEIALRWIAIAERHVAVHEWRLTHLPGFSFAPDPLRPRLTEQPVPVA